MIRKEVRQIVSLARSLQPLEDHFNSNNKPRFLALLSPTCLFCLEGARAVQRSIIEDFPHVDIGVSVVWINMMEGDTKAAAERSARIINDPRVRHFHDPKRRSGEAIGKSLGWKDKVAWDTYLFYERGSRWMEAPPAPLKWIHQLPWDTQADPAHFHTGDDLVEALHKIMKELTEMLPPFTPKKEGHHG